MTTKTRPKRKPTPRVARATRELLCLLASYDAYGTGAAWSGCLLRLAARRTVP